MKPESLSISVNYFSVWAGGFYSRMLMGSWNTTWGALDPAHNFSTTLCGTDFKYSTSPNLWLNL